MKFIRWQTKRSSHAFQADKRQRKFRSISVIKYNKFKYFFDEKKCSISWVKHIVATETTKKIFIYLHIEINLAPLLIYYYHI